MSGLYPFPLIYTLVSVSVSYTIDDCNFVIQSEVREPDSSCSMLLSQDCFGYSMFFCVDIVIGLFSVLVLRYFCIIWITMLYQMRVLQIFSPRLWLTLPQKLFFFLLMKSRLSILWFMDIAFGFISKGISITVSEFYNFVFYIHSMTIRVIFQ